MPEKSPETWSLATWLIVMGMSLLGGFTSYYRRVKAGMPAAISFIEILGEAALCVMMGFCGFLFADWWFNDQRISIASSGLAAHFAVRLLFGAEGLIAVVIKKIEFNAAKKIK